YFCLRSPPSIILPSQSISRRPPSSTHSPYTTLFRSLHHVHPREEVIQERGDHILQRHQGSDAVLGGGALHRLRAAGGVDGDEPGDRKSTRLNSSHVSISYAVFCLKKNKIISMNQW